MKKVRAAIVGYGNIGHYVLEALQAAPDFEIAGVVRRAGAENCPAELSAYPVVKNIKELKDVDVAILCTPTRKVEEYAKEILILWTVSISIRVSLPCAAHWMQRLKSIIRYPSFLPAGIRVVTPLSALCWKPLLRKALPILILVRV